MKDEQKIKIALLDKAADLINRNQVGYICVALQYAQHHIPIPCNSRANVSITGVRYALTGYISGMLGKCGALEAWLYRNGHIDGETLRQYNMAPFPCHPDMKVYRLRWIKEMKRLVREGEL